jgi:hypothetical protein
MLTNCPHRCPEHENPSANTSIKNNEERIEE